MWGFRRDQRVSSLTAEEFGQYGQFRVAKLDDWVGYVVLGDFGEMVQIQFPYV